MQRLQGSHLLRRHDWIPKKIGKEETSLKDTRLLPQLRIGMLCILRRSGFRIKVIYVSLLPLGPFS